MNYKRLLKTVCVVLLCSVSASAASEVSVRISDGIDNEAVKARMERTLSAILTEANVAYESHRQMRYATLGIPADVQSSLAALWDNSPFVTMDNEIVEKCLTTGTGYQVRNLPLLLKPLDGEKVLQDEEYQEGVASFDRQGNLTSFYLAISMNLYMNVVRENRDITDLRRRQLILDYVEQFRTAYNQKDLDFLDAVFSEDALIITGKVIKRKSMEGIRLPDKIIYKKQDKTQYLSNLKRVFSLNKSIHVNFDEIEVMRHPSHVDFYGVTLHQGYRSDSYRDEGYVFLLWDFRDEAHPQIHVRTWQPDKYNRDGKGQQRIPKEEIFSLSDFDI